MGYIFHPPLSGNPLQNNTDTKPRPEVLLELDKAESAAFLMLGRCWAVFEETQALVDETNKREAANIWSRLFCRILELEGAT